MSTGATSKVTSNRIIWLPPRDSNPDMLIQSPFAGTENKETKDLSSADSGKTLQNPHHPRTKNSAEESVPPKNVLQPDNKTGGTPST
jgi:hypothetical protein